MDKRNLRGRLDAHFATRRFSSLSDALKRGAGNWQLYAAVTGSAMAMATNASADIIYSGLQFVTAGPVASITSHQAHTVGYNTVHLKNGTGAPVGNFEIGVGQFDGGEFAAAAVGFGSQFRFLVTSSSGLVKKLHRGATISSAAGRFSSSVHSIVRQSHYTYGTQRTYGWTAGKKGFAGFSFSTSNGQRDYGWVHLVFDVGANGLANQLTAIDWAYDAGGNAISAGEGEVPPTPEASTGALALLAAGAAGVAALRRRRKTAVEQ